MKNIKKLFLFEYKRSTICRSDIWTARACSTFNLTSALSRVVSIPYNVNIIEWTIIFNSLTWLRVDCDKLFEVDGFYSNLQFYELIWEDAKLSELEVNGIVS